MDETIVEEMKAEEVEQESKETVKLPHKDDNVIKEPASSDAFSGSVACTNLNKTEKNFVSLSGSVDKVNECSLELQDSMEAVAKAKNSLYFKKMK